LRISENKFYKQEGCESAKTNFTKDDVMKYVIGALQ